MNLDKRLRLYSNMKNDSMVDKEKVHKTIQASKSALYQGEMEVPMSGLDFLYQQAGFIRKRWWVAQVFVLLILWWFLFVSESTIYMQRWMGIMAPAFTILIFPELWKSQANGLIEIEAASYFSISRVYAARMMLFAMVDVLLLSVFFLVSAFTLKLTLAGIIVQFILPMNVTCGICFQCMVNNRTDSGYYASFLSLIWVAVWTLVVLQENVYQRITAPMWVGAVLISIVYFIYSIYKVWKSCGQYWEVNVSWN